MSQAMINSRIRRAAGGGGADRRAGRDQTADAGADDEEDRDDDRRGGPEEGAEVVAAHVVGVERDLAAGRVVGGRGARRRRRELGVELPREGMSPGGSSGGRGADGGCSVMGRSLDRCGSLQGRLQIERTWTGAP